eukprot:5166344-Pleurochrysis_carterae.AAC.3
MNWTCDVATRVQYGCTLPVRDFAIAENGGTARRLPCSLPCTMVAAAAGEASRIARADLHHPEAAPKKLNGACFPAQQPPCVLPRVPFLLISLQPALAMQSSWPHAFDTPAKQALAASVGTLHVSMLVQDGRFQKIPRISLDSLLQYPCIGPFSRRARLQHAYQAQMPCGACYDVCRRRPSLQPHRPDCALLSRNFYGPMMSAVESQDMIDSLQRRLESANDRVVQAIALLNLPMHEEQAEELEALSSQPEFWDDAPTAEITLKKLNAHRAAIEQASSWRSTLEEVETVVALARETAASSSDDALEALELMSEASERVDGLEEELRKWETRTLMNGEYDAYGATLTITAGAGGVDAQDWAAMLLRMYERWAAKAGYDVRLVERSEGACVAAGVEQSSRA